MIVLSLDISSKTGFAVGEVGSEIKLIDSGTLSKKERQTHLNHPFDTLFWAKDTFSDIKKLIEKHKPEHIVVEQTCTSRNALDQKFLEFCHCQLAEYLVANPVKITYYMTGEWRGLVGCKMTKEQKDQNKEVKKQKAATGKSIAYGKDGKRIGKVGKKHVNVMKANELFGKSLILGQNDEADALLLLEAFRIANITQRGSHG